MASRDFFEKLRGLCLFLEKETKQLERALRGEDVGYEEEPPIKVLHDLQCEIITLKEEVNASIDKSCSEKQAVHKFMKASEILMQRNAADLGKIRELFQKYGYKPRVKDTAEEKDEGNSDSMVSAQNESTEKADVPHPPACAEKPLVPKDPLLTPQLSDFGLSQYTFTRPWSTVKGQHATNSHQDNSKSRTPLKTQMPWVLPKTPKCTLKMDEYECVTPKLESFGITEHTVCMNQDYTMSLIHKTAQTSNKPVKREDNAVCLSGTASREITPRLKPKATAENADWIASPMVLMFCTPDVKIPSKTNTTVISRTPETNEQPLPSHTETPRVPDFETRWLKPEAKVQVKRGETSELVTKTDAADKQHTKDRTPLAVSSNEYLQHFGDPTPPKIKPYDQLLDTPPAPGITRIPDDVLQIVYKYTPKVDSSKSKEAETKTGNGPRYKSDFTDDFNKENRAYPGLYKPNN